MYVVWLPICHSKDVLEAGLEFVGAHLQFHGPILQHQEGMKGTSTEADFPGQGTDLMTHNH